MQKQLQRTDGAAASEEEARRLARPAVRVQGIGTSFPSFGKEKFKLQAMMLSPMRQRRRDW